MDEYFFVLSCQRNFRFLVEDWSFLQNLHVPISPRPCKIPLTSNMSQIVTMLKVLVHSGYNENLSITFVARLIFVIDHLFLSPLSSLLRMKYILDDHREPVVICLTEYTGELVEELFKSPHLL